VGCSPRPQKGREGGGGQGEGRGSVRGREGTIQDGEVGEGAEELADELDGGGRHCRRSTRTADQSESEKKEAKPNGPNCISTIEILWPVLGWELTGLK
jgi:hypothetical protein